MCQREAASTLSSHDATLNLFGNVFQLAPSKDDPVVQPLYLMIILQSSESAGDRQR
jgi:hypothetical protein